MDAHSLAWACGIVGLVNPEQKKDNLKLLLKYILWQFNSEDAKGSDEGGSSWYKKLHDHLDWIHKKQLVKKTNLVAGSYKLLKGVTLKLDIQCRERLYFSFNFG